MKRETKRDALVCGIGLGDLVCEAEGLLPGAFARAWYNFSSYTLSVKWSPKISTSLRLSFGVDGERKYLMWLLAIHCFVVFWK